MLASKAMQARPGCRAVLMVAAATISNTRLDRAALTANVEPVYLPKAEYLAPMALGWRNALADVLWFRTISYFGAHYRSDHTYPWLASMCDLVTDLDPRAEHVYRFSGVILPWEANQVDAGIALLQKGLRQFPDDWMLHYHLGFHYFFFKNDIDAALASLRSAMALPGAHPSLARLAAVLAQHQYGPETTLSFLQELADDVDNSEVRGVVEEHMREAQLSADLERLQAAVETYKQRTSGAPPPSLQALVDTGLLASIPADPFDKGYEIDPTTGAVRSASGRVPRAARQPRARPRAARRVRSRAMTTRAATIHRHTARRRAVDAPRADVGAEPLLELCGLSKDYRHNWTMRRLRVLHELDLVVRRGEILGLIGPNGAGKTTTFKCLLGLLRPSAGRVLFEGQPLGVRARAAIGFLPEQPYFYDYLTVQETLSLYAHLYGQHGRAARARVAEVIEQVQLAPNRRAPLRTLSKGTMQRVGIAQAILNRPRLLILDEPMSGLDPIGRHAMRELVSYRRCRRTIIFSSHILPDAEALCDRVAIPPADACARSSTWAPPAPRSTNSSWARCPPTPWRRSSARGRSPGGRRGGWRLRLPDPPPSARRSIWCCRRHRRESRPRASVARGALPRPRRVRHPLE